MEGANQHEEQQVSIEDTRIPSDGEESVCESPGPSAFGRFERMGMIRLEEGNNIYVDIKGCFLYGMGQLRERTTVVAFHVNPFTRSPAKPRHDTFEIFSAAVASKNNGDPNQKNGWYGTSIDEVCRIISHGFSPRPEFPNGICITPLYCSGIVALSSTPDEDGLRHLLLCYVTLGKMEVIPPSLNQHCPSSDEFDSGVDNPLNPKGYLVWTSHMNSHILPMGIISYTISSNQNLERRVQAPTPIYNLRPMSLTRLMSKLSNVVSAPTMSRIRRNYASFQANEINQMLFMHRLQEEVGEEFLAAIIRTLGNEVNAGTSNQQNGNFPYK